MAAPSNHFSQIRKAQIREDALRNAPAGARNGRIIPSGLKAHMAQQNAMARRPLRSGPGGMHGFKYSR